MKRFLFFMIMVCVVFFYNENVFTQKNEIGVSTAVSIYGNPELSPSFDGKYTQYDGVSFNGNYYYSRLFKEEASSLTVELGAISRDRFVIDSLTPYTVRQNFFCVKLIYSKNIQLSERVAWMPGLGVVYNALTEESWKYAKSAQDSTTRKGGLQSVGFVFDTPIRILLYKKHYFKMGMRFASEFGTTPQIPLLFSGSIYATYAIRF